MDLTESHCSRNATLLWGSNRKLVSFTKSFQSEFSGYFLTKFIEYSISFSIIKCKLHGMISCSVRSGMQVSAMSFHFHRLYLSFHLKRSSDCTVWKQTLIYVGCVHLIQARNNQGKSVI